MTKNFLKVQGLKALCLTLAVALVLVPRSYAVNLQDAQQAQADETASSAYQVGGANVANAVNLLFTGRTQTGAVATSTGAYVTISATAMTFYNPYATLDTSVGTAGVITYASTLGSNTMGGLCDYLNGLGAKYRCRLMGAKRDDPPVILKTQTETDGTSNLQATSLKPLAGGFSVKQTTTTFISLGIQPAPGRRVVLGQCTTNGAGGGAAAGANDNGFQVYGQLRKFGAVAPAPVSAELVSPVANVIRDPYGVVADDTYNVWTSSPAANTATILPGSTIASRWIEFAQDAHVVVRQGNTNSVEVQAATNSLSCIWAER